MQKSKKPIKNPRDFLLPYHVTFPQNVHIQVNNVHCYFPANKEVELTQGEYETILHSADYAQFL